MIRLSMLCVNFFGGITEILSFRKQTDRIGQDLPETGNRPAFLPGGRVGRKEIS